MAILNKDIIGAESSSLESERLDKDTLEIQAQAEARIKKETAGFGTKIRNLIPWGKKNKVETENGMKVDVKKKSIVDFELGQPGHTDKVKIGFKEGFRWDLSAVELQNAMLAAMPKGGTGPQRLEVLKTGMHLDIPTAAKDITDDQIIELATKMGDLFMHYRSGHTTLFKDTGVNDFNAKLAASYLKDFSDSEMEAILNPEGGGHGDLEKLEGKSKLHSLLGDAAKLETIGTTDPVKKFGGSDKMSYEDAVEELKNIEFDEILISNDDSSKTGKSRSYKSKKPVDWSATTDVDKVDSKKNSRLSMLNTQKEEAIKLIEKYEKIGKHFEKIAKACKKVDIDFSSTGLKDYVAGDPLKFASGKLDEKIDPAALSKKWMKEFDIEEKGYEKELAEAKKKAEAHGDHHESLSGADAVIAVFKAHLKKTQKVSDARAEELAYSLFVKNSIDDSMKAHLNQTIKDDILKNGLDAEENGILGYFARKGKEFMYGDEGTYVANLAKKAGIPYSRFMGAPDYSKITYPKAATMYYALRDSVKEGQLTNSMFVRGQLLEVGHLLATKFATDTLSLINRVDEGGGAHGGHGAEKKEGEGHAEKHDAHMTKAQSIAKSVSELKTNTKVMLGDDAPPPHDVEVRKCIDYAKTNTAKYRRSVANGAKNLGLSTLGMGEWANWKNPAAYPALALKNGGEYTWNHKGSIGASTAFGTVAGAFILPGIGAPIGAALGAGIGAVAAKPIEALGRSAKSWGSWFITRPGAAAGGGGAHHAE